MERLCVNAKDIDMSAFAGMESLKEIHIRGGVEHMSLGAFALLPSIETICLEGIDPEVMESDLKLKYRNGRQIGDHFKIYCIPFYGRRMEFLRNFLAS